MLQYIRSKMQFKAFYDTYNVQGFTKEQRDDFWFYEGNGWKSFY